MEDCRNNEDDNLDDMLYVLGNPQKRDIDVRISPAQFLRNRELDIRGEKHGIVIRERSFLNGFYSRDRKYTHDYGTNVIRTMKRDIGGIDMSMY